MNDRGECGRLVIDDASRHALSRYREHHPAADLPDLIAAAALSLPIESTHAHALTGRPRAARGDDQDVTRHLLHPEGTGIFVVAPVAPFDGTARIITYLRLHGREQQRMARSWFLEPVQVLRTAFELGFEAARRPGAPEAAVAASEAWMARLAALAPQLAGADLEVEEAETESLEPPPVDLREELFQWDPAAAEMLQWFARTHAHLVGDVGAWAWLSPAGFRLAVAQPHVGFLDGAQAVLLEPGGLAMALAIPRPGERLLLRRLFNVPRRLRQTLLDRVLAPGDGPELVSAPVPALGVDAEALVLLDAREVRVWGWNPRARREADALDYAVIAPGWLDQLAVVVPGDIPDLAARVGWELRSDRAYAARRDRDVVLLMTGPLDSAQLSVDRCARDPAGDPLAD